MSMKWRIWASDEKKAKSGWAPPLLNLKSARLSSPLDYFKSNILRVATISQAFSVPIGHAFEVIPSLAARRNETGILSTNVYIGETHGTQPGFLFIAQSLVYDT